MSKRMELPGFDNEAPKTIMYGLILGFALIGGLFVAFGGCNQAQAQCWGATVPGGLSGSPVATYPVQSPVYATPAQGNAKAIKGEYTWWSSETNMRIMELWRGNTLVGELDPFSGQWKSAWADKFQSLPDQLEKFHREAGRQMPTGDLVQAQAKEKKPEPVAATQSKDKPKLNARVCECDHPCKCDPCQCNSGKVEKNIDGDPIDTTAYQRFKGDFGVSMDRITSSGYQYSGRHVSQAEALERMKIGSGKIPNDADLPRIIIIGTESAKKQVLDDFKSHPNLAYWKDRALVQHYTQGDWEVSPERGFVQPAPNQVMIQAMKPDGTVLWRQMDYAGGAPVLAKALRDRVPGYDPSKDPQPPKDDAIKIDETKMSPGWWAAIGAAIVAALGWLFKKRGAA